MRSVDIFNDYVWLVTTLGRAGRLSLQELSDRWQRRSDRAPLARSTFNRYRSAIQDLFGIKIKCDKSNGNVYYIEDLEKHDSVMNWMISSLAVDNMIYESRSLRNRIVLESIPFSGDTLQMALDAMTSNRLVEITYRGYDQPERHYFVEPFCIRLFRQRWYLLGHFENKFRLFSFDRIIHMSVSDIRFKMPADFDGDEFFNEFFGIVTDLRVKRRRIVIRAHGRERFYLRDLPLHYTQNEIASSADSTDFELYLRPTNDFMDAIFSRGGKLEVISPADLREELVGRARAMLAAFTLSGVKS